MELEYDETETVMVLVLFWIHFPDTWEQNVMKVTHPRSKEPKVGEKSSVFSINTFYWVEKCVSIKYEKSSRYQEIFKSMELGYGENEKLVFVVLFWIHVPDTWT